MKQAGLICAAALFLTACGDEPAEPVTRDTSAETAIADTELETVDKVETEDMPIVGGPCSYEVSMLEAHVVAIEDDQVEMNDNDANVFYLQLSDFPSPPRPGDDYTIKREMITEGTCTPEIYTVQEGDVGGVE